MRRAGSVSIYVPTTPVSAQVSASQIDLKNAIGEALGQLRDADFDKRELAALEEGLTDVLDDEEWQFQAHTLAVFATPERAVTFRLGNRVARTVEVSDRFHVKPLFRVASFPQVALVLALAAGSVRLIEIEPDLPASYRTDRRPPQGRCVRCAQGIDQGPFTNPAGSKGPRARRSAHAVRTRRRASDRPDRHVR